MNGHALRRGAIAPAADEWEGFNIHAPAIPKRATRPKPVLEVVDCGPVVSPSFVPPPRGVVAIVGGVVYREDAPHWAEVYDEVFSLFLPDPKP